jgi:hypothetical protein
MFMNILQTPQLEQRRACPWSRQTVLVALLAIGAAVLVACAGGRGDPYAATFDEAGNWSTGEDTYSQGQVTGGVYDLLIKEADISRWAPAGENFADGIYEVEATVVDGPIDNGYGMLFRADPENGNFYLFKISADGYAWIGRYRDESEETPIIGDHWFASPAVNQGLNQPNQLRVRAESGNLIFYVNDQEVGRVTDHSFTAGDIGLYAQALGVPGTHVQFDNFTVTPLE